MTSSLGPCVTSRRRSHGQNGQKTDWSAQCFQFEVARTARLKTLLRKRSSASCEVYESSLSFIYVCIIIHAPCRQVNSPWVTDRMLAPTVSTLIRPLHLVDDLSLPFPRSLTKFRNCLSCVVRWSHEEEAEFEKLPASTWLCTTSVIPGSGAPGD